MPTFRLVGQRHTVTIDKDGYREEIFPAYSIEYRDAGDGYLIAVEVPFAEHQFDLEKQPDGSWK